MTSQLQYCKAVAGIMLSQIWTIAIFVHIYLIYLLITKQELWILIYLGILEIVQIYTTKSTTLIGVFRWFNSMKMFDEAEIIEMEPTKKQGSMFCFHPHGIFTHGMLMNLHTKDTFFENLIILGSRIAMNLPISGLIFKLLGLQGVNASNLSRLLKSEQNVGLVPGGFEEATITSKKENRVYIKSRKGFIKYALRYGVTIYPVFTFGENQLYYTFDKFIKFRLWLNQFKVIGTLFASRFLTFPEPHTSMITVCGKGIHCPKIENPTKEQIDAYHAQYIHGLKELYSLYSPKYAPKMPLVLY